MSGKVRLWLDDLLDNPDHPERHTPEGWVGVKTALAACRLLSKGGVEHISFDHDLGEVEDDHGGYIVAKFIEKWAFHEKIQKLTWDIHSANPTGAANITRAMECADRYWAQKPCVWCSGTGIVQETGIICRTCRGSGRS